MNRRDFLATSMVLLVPPPTHERVTREIFLRSPGKGTTVYAYAFYTQATGGSLLSIEERMSRSDTVDVAYLRNSEDNGRTWSAPTEVRTGEKRPEGMWRKHLRAGYIDPHTGRFIRFWCEGILPTDDPLEGMRQWNIFYSVDGEGKYQIIQHGKEFNATHALPGIYTGKNAVMLGDVPCLPITRKDGTILLPVQTTPLGPDGKLFNPGGGYTYTDCAVLHARWKGKQLEWKMGDTVKADPDRSTRGMDEAAIGTLADGRVIMVMRGSNSKKTTLPGYRWISYSSDGGWHWTKPAPWTYTNGDPFYSPSSCSQLLRHSNGKLYWLGNISPINPHGNSPRYPFFVGEVDQDSGLLIRESLIKVDDRQPGESEILMLSSPYAREDRETKQIALHMTRVFAFPDGWLGDASLYRIDV
ncbi:MAG: sialidase family protein [Acidobacteriota bacterium]|nr:sialidase family protein [Acidobacteriota bacterium]